MSHANVKRPRCRCCGRALASVYEALTERIETPSLAGGVDFISVPRRGRHLGFGYGATGLFCSLTCGHRWACTSIRQAEKLS